MLRTTEEGKLGRGTVFLHLDRREKNIKRPRFQQSLHHIAEQLGRGVVDIGFSHQDIVSRF